MADERTPLLSSPPPTPPKLPPKPPPPSFRPTAAPKHPPHIHLSPSAPPGQTLSLPALARAAAALKAGHLPSTAQLLSLFDSLLSSSLLSSSTDSGGSEPIGVGRLTREGERVRLAAREAVWSVRELVEGRNPVLKRSEGGMEGETDEVRLGEGWQEFVWRCRRSEVDLHAPSTSPPTSAHAADEATALRASLLTLLQLFLTSPALRSLLTDAFLLLRDTLDVAIETAEKRDHLLKPGAAEALEQVVEGVAEKAVGEEAVREHGERLKGERAERMSYAAVVAAKAAPDPDDGGADLEVEKVEVDVDVDVEVAAPSTADPPEVEITLNSPEQSASPSPFDSPDDTAAADPPEQPIPLVTSSSRSTPPPVPTPPAVPEKSAEQLKDAFVDRFKDILLQLQSTPSFQRSASTLLSLTRAYLARTLSGAVPSVSISASAPPEAEEEKAKKNGKDQDPTELLIPLLEPFTGGAGSLSPLREAFTAVLAHLSAPSPSPSLADEKASSPLLEGDTLAAHLRLLASQLDLLLSRALLVPGWIGSSSSHRALSELHTSLLSSAASFPALQRSLSVFLSLLLDALADVARDPLLGRAARAVEGLVEALLGWVKAAGETAGRVAIGDGVGAVWGDLVEWVVPRVLGVLKEVPLPRIEFASPSLSLAIDPPSLLQTSFIPSSLTLRTSTSLTYIPTSGSSSLALPPSASSPAPPALAAAPAAARTSYAASTAIHVEGLRMEVRDVGYFARYHTGIPCVGDIEESGLLDLQFGAHPKGGLALSLATTSSSAAGSKDTLFDVDPSETHATLTHFDLRPHHSSHPLLMWLARPAMRAAVRKVVEHEVREVVLLEGARAAGEWGWRVREAKRRTDEGAEGEGREVRGEGTGKEEGEVWKWVRAVWEVLSGADVASEAEEAEEQQEQEHDDDAGVDAKSALSALTSSSASSLEPPPGALDYHLHVSQHGLSLDLERGPSFPSTSDGTALTSEQPSPVGTVGFGTEGVVLPPGSATIPLPDGKRKPKGLRKAAREAVDREVEEGRRAARSVGRTVGEAGEVRDEWEGMIEEEEEKGSGWRSSAFDLSG
ncbi:hypothetical protein JCM10213_007647 [Rhodosporidiobolus nylandii]